MLLAFITCQLSALVIANPFHKYPSVFLLDVGNEELEKTNTEQIRLSVPGGSVALRYPAIGDGELIGHLRVSSIDFGTALKANIVDGGPGYKYAVLVLMGNPGVPYDAVVTVQTVNEQALNIPNVAYETNSGVNAIPVEEDENNSAEDFSDGPVSSYQSESIVQNSNAELTQSSNNVYNYVENEVADQSDKLEDDNNYDSINAVNDEQDTEEENEDDDSGTENNDTGNENDQTDIHKEYTDDIDQVDDSNIQVKGIDTYDEDKDEDISPELERFTPNDYAEDKPPNFDEESYGPPDEANVRADYQQVPLDYEEAYEMDPIFNDGEVHNNGDKYKDSNNNNYIDSDDNYAVEY
ncbi:hypothetical protein HF086_012140 [Spodoptera exigua]|uniref:Uncharacterized protein n=1 Tax=Spodoptera exigua TaxID=7107 RepID=A0A922SB70_SPOEX|nr:hypothetical protein HF086_012140 [Spodoptera exigua]